LLWSNHRGTWYRYEKNVWTSASEDDIDAQIKAWLRKTHRDSLSPSMANAIRSIIDSADRAHIDSSIEAPAFKSNGVWQSGGAWTSFSNGLLNIDKLLAGDADAWREHTPEIFVLGSKDYAYDKDAKCPKWTKYLEEVLPDADARRCVQLMFGYLLTHSTKYNCFFLLQGAAGAGKSVCVDTLRAMLGGEANCSSIELANLSKTFQRYLLCEKLANVVSEGQTEAEGMSYGSVEGVIKDICDGGSTTLEKKYGNVYGARYTARLVFAQNDLPKWADKSNGIWDRLRIIPFEQRIRGTAKDNLHLRTEIESEEIAGVFNWALEGLKELRTLKRMPECAAGEARKAKSREDSDHERQFLLAHCKADRDATIPNSALFGEYCSWMERNRYRAVGAQRFNDAVQRVFPTVKISRVGSCRGWKGLKFDVDGVADLLPEEAEEPKEEKALQLQPPRERDATAICKEGDFN
jgi:P4 family phage/plasmid primase-like protien